MREEKNVFAPIVDPVEVHVAESDCPRCHEVCGWCGDYRWMHGLLKLPGSRLKCEIPGNEPEGELCPVCRGAKRVTRTTTYAAMIDQALKP